MNENSLPTTVGGCIPSWGKLQTSGLEATFFVLGVGGNLSPFLIRNKRLLGAGNTKVDRVLELTLAGGRS